MATTHWPPAVRDVANQALNTATAAAASNRAPMTARPVGRGLRPRRNGRPAVGALGNESMEGCLAAVLS